MKLNQFSKTKYIPTGSGGTNSSKRPRRALHVGILIFVILILCGIFILVKITKNKDTTSSNSNSNTVSTANISQINSLIDENNCEESIKQLKDISANKNDQTISVSLLSHRASCYYRLKMYDDALRDYKELRAIYLTRKDKNIDAVDASIAEINKYIAHPELQPKSKPKTDLDEMNPEFKEQIQQQKGETNQ